MSLTSSISVLTQAMRNFQTAQNVVANNIANATTTGYSRQVVNFQENVSERDAGFSVGLGATISEITRMRNTFVDTQIRSMNSDLGYNQAVEDGLKQLQALFPDITTTTLTSGIAGCLNQFYSAWSDLSANPTNNGIKQEVISAGLAVSDALRQTATSLGNLRKNLDDQVVQTLSDVNNLLDQVGSYNAAIMTYPSTAGKPNDLLDKRTQALRDLSELIDVKYADNTNGSVTVFFNQGVLVNGSDVNRFKTINGLPNPELVKIGFSEKSPIPLDVTDQLRGGKLGGLLKVRDDIMGDVVSGIQNLGAGLIENTNLIYAAGKDAAGTHASFFTGTNSASIAVSNILASSATGAELVSAFSPSSVDPADLAKAMAASRSMYVASYVQSSSAISAGAYSGDTAINAQAPLIPPLAPSGAIRIDLSPSSWAIVNWTSADTLNTIAARITTALAGAGVAVYNDASRQFTILNSQAISLYDQSGNLARSLKLTAFIKSASNINACVDPTFREAQGSDILNSQQDLLNLFAAAMPKGTIKVDGVNSVWVSSVNSIDDVTNLITFNTGLKVIAYFDPAQQKVMMLRNNGNPTMANPLTTFSASDVFGNFSKVANIIAPTGTENLYSGLQGDISGKLTDATTQAEAATNTVQQLDNVQDEQASVDLNNELAQARLYQRSYEASVRVLGIIDEMMNMLINRIGTQSSSVSGGTI